MDNKDLPAYPCGAYGQQTETGLTKREMISAMCLQGLISSDRGINSTKAAASLSINFADELLTQLNPPGNAY